MIIKAKRFSIKQIAAALLSSAALTVASASSSTACFAFYHQPKSPQNIKARLAEIKRK